MALKYIQAASTKELHVTQTHLIWIFVCNFIGKEKYWELMNGQRALDILDWPVIVIRPPRWHFNGRSEENNGSRAAQLPALETDAMHHISCISFKTLLKAQWIKPWVLKVQNIYPKTGNMPCFSVLRQPAKTDSPLVGCSSTEVMKAPWILGQFYLTLAGLQPSCNTFLEPGWYPDKVHFTSSKFWYILRRVKWYVSPRWSTSSSDLIT